MSRPPELLYSVDETPPRAVLIVASLQQVAVMSNSLAYPIILAREAGLSGSQMLDFVSLSMLTLGIATVLLCARSRFIGGAVTHCGDDRWACFGLRHDHCGGLPAACYGADAA